MSGQEWAVKAYTSEHRRPARSILGLMRRPHFELPAATLALCLASLCAAGAPRPIAELTPLAKLTLGKTADWVAITADAVWVGSTGPYAVHRIDPGTNRVLASVILPGEPCAGLTADSRSLWVPLCTAPPSLAKVNLKSNKLESIFAVGPAAGEGGVASGAGSVWLIVNKSGDLARIDPAGGAILATLHVPAGSYNPIFVDGMVWVTHVDGAELTGVDAASGKMLSTVATGPNPRFLTAGAGAIWTLNQGDGSLTRIDMRSKQTATIPLGTPGHGGDIAFSDCTIWTSMMKVPLSLIDANADRLMCQWSGAGGDSLGIGHGAIWLTDYHAGTIERIAIKDALAHCPGG
jgi:virginiamycin B lyase